MGSVPELLQIYCEFWSVCLSSVSLSSCCKLAHWDLWPGGLGLQGWCCAIGKSSSNAAPKAGESTLCWEGTMQKLGCFSTASKPELLRKSLLYKRNKKTAWRKVWCLGFFSGIFYFFLDFPWKAAKACPPNWQQAEVTKKREKEERRGEKNWCWRVRAREVGTQAKKNELVRRCYENSR